MTVPFMRPLGILRRCLTGGNVYAIGLQMSLEAMHLVQLQASANGVAFRAAASVNYGCSLEDILAKPLALRRLVRRALTDQPFRGRRVVTCMPTNQVKTLVVNYTLAEGESDAEAITRELGARLDGNIEGLVFDFVPVRQNGSDGSRREALVATAAKEHVTRYLTLLSSAGLDAIAIDIGPVALARVISRVGERTQGDFQNLLLINFGSHSSFVTVFWGRRLMLDRPIEFAERRLITRLKTAMDMPEPMARRLLLELGFVHEPDDDGWAEIGAALREVLRPEFTALKAEVSKTLIYTASKTRGKTVDKIYLVGSVARYPGVAELLSDELSMPTEVLDPFSMFDHRTQPIRRPRFSQHTSAAVATGLALRGVPASWPNSI